MKKGIIYPVSRITRKADKEGESIESMLRKMVSGNEPIKATAKIEYHERKEGVLPQYDIRSDRFMYAMQAADRVHASNYAARMEQDGFIMADGKWMPKPEEAQA